MNMIVKTILLSTALAAAACGRPEDGGSDLGSLTDSNYSGHKYYLGWGAAAAGDPSMMHNEVKYDVLHTHDIFTADLGGDYEGQKLIGSHVSGDDVRQQWNALEEKLGPEDMYVQYSSGHGFSQGLGIGLSYNEMADFALSTQAKEVIVLTMACYSGNLVDSFNRRQAEWQDWREEGRQLFVMASSSRSQTSSTGPGRDSEEEGGPSGSAGSAFGHALWKSLIGHADGFVDGIKDGYLSLAEIRYYTESLTRRVGGHDPQTTGSYDPNLIMNRVPSASVAPLMDDGESYDADELREWVYVEE